MVERTNEKKYKNVNGQLVEYTQEEYDRFWEQREIDYQEWLANKDKKTNLEKHAELNTLFDSFPVEKQMEYHDISMAISMALLNNKLPLALGFANTLPEGENKTIILSILDS